MTQVSVVMSLFYYDMTLQGYLHEAWEHRNDVLNAHQGSL